MGDGPAMKQMGDILESVVMVMHMERANLSVMEGHALLHKALQHQTYRKNQLCMELMDAWQCTNKFMDMLPMETKGALNETLHSLFMVAEHMCMRKCGVMWLCFYNIICFLVVF